MAEQEPGSHEMHITLERDLELEASVPETRGLFSWLGDAIISVVTYVYDKVVSNVIDPYISTINYEPWGNSKGWKPKNWMSLLPDDLPVCCVNIPGSHDSGTASIDFVGKTVSADCQSYSIEEQYDMGARYFDLRVGCEFSWDQSPSCKRLPNESEQAGLKDLFLYHGNFCCDVGYKASLLNLAGKIRGTTRSSYSSTPSGRT